MVKLKKLKEADLLKIESESRSSSKSKIKEKINLKVQSISSFWVGIFVKVTRWAKNIREKQFSYIKVDIFNLDEQYRLIMDIPGIKDEALNIEMSPDRIVVSCNRDDSESATYQERVTGKAKRTIWFDEKVDPETCEMRLINGVLRIDVKHAEIFKAKVEVDDFVPNLLKKINHEEQASKSQIAG